MSPIAGLFALLSIIAAYFLPAILAGHRKHRNAAAILVLTIFAGWTGIGWVVALVWSMTDNVKGGAA